MPAEPLSRVRLSWFAARKPARTLRSVTTSNSGSFNITNLPAGRYTVTVKNAGFQTFVAKDVILNVAEKHTLDVGLLTGTTTATVEVTAENTPIQTTTAEESGTVTGEQVRELALSNRNFEQLVLLQPGVKPTWRQARIRPQQQHTDLDQRRAHRGE